MKQSRIKEWLAVHLGAALALVAISVFGWAGAGYAATPQPAWYTYQAPGGAATAGQKVIALTFDGLFRVSGD